MTPLASQLDPAAATSPEIAASAPEVSVVMPCLNEADTLEVCIRKALAAFDAADIAGEVIVADNGSTDGSQAIASAARRARRPRRPRATATP